MQNDLQCPYCGGDNEVCHDDIDLESDEDTLHEKQCRHCDKYFVFEKIINITYEAHAADCLNTGNHEYEKTHTYPPEFATWRCKHCGDEKPISFTVIKAF